MHVVIYGLKDKNHTTNLNPWPEDGRRAFRELGMQDGQLSLIYKGGSEVMGTRYDLSF